MLDCSPIETEVLTYTENLTALMGLINLTYGFLESKR